MSDDIRALEDRHDALTREHDTLVRSNQNRRGVILLEATNIHILPVLLVLLLAGLLGAGVGLVLKPPKRTPPSMNCLKAY